HHFAGPGRASPVDAVERVTWRVFADAGGVGRDIVRATATAALARKVRGWRLEVRKVDDGWVHQDLLGGANLTDATEDAKRVGGGEAERAPVVEAATEEGGIYNPVAR